MVGDIEDEVAGLECFGAGDEKADEMHGVFPPDGIVGPEVALHFQELAVGISVKSLKDLTGEETLSVCPEFVGEL